MPKPPETHTVASHFAGKPQLRAVYDKVVAALRRLGDVREEPKKTSIHLARRSAAAGIQVRKDCLILTIKSDQPLTSQRLFKSEQTSASRYHHEFKLTKPTDVDAELKAWLKRAYELSE
jgi:hypothetical protein